MLQTTHPFPRCPKPAWHVLPRAALVRSSENITATAGTVLVRINGGNTATGVRPAGTSAKACAVAGLVKSVGEPPPPGSPGWVLSGGASPGWIGSGDGKNNKV